MADGAPDEDHSNTEGATVDDLLGYARAPIVDALWAYGGLNSLNIVNSIYAVRKAHLTLGDLQYAMFNGTGRRLIRSLRDKPHLTQEARLAAESLGLRLGNQHNLDTYYGQLIDYSWHDKGTARGANFTPIYGAFERVQTRYPAHASSFDVIRRRLVYLEILASELAFILERFDSSKLPKLHDWHANKFEAFASQAAEIIVQVGELHYAITDKRRNIRFEDALTDLTPLSRLFDSIDATLELLLVMYLRNVIVHDFKNHVSIEGSDATINFHVPCKKNFGVLFKYLQEDVLSEKYATPISHETIEGATYRTMADGRFPYVSFRFRRSQAGSWSVQGAVLQYNMSVSDFSRRVFNLLFHLCRSSTTELDVPKTHGK